MEQYYKVLKRGEDGELHSCAAGKYVWEPGTWYTSEGALILCENGFHVTTKPYMWLNNLYWEVWKAEVEGVQGRPDAGDGKVVVRRVRITEKVADPQWLTDAKATVKWLASLPSKYFAARGAAWDAAWDAARDAAWAAAWDAARVAARGAAWDAAWAAAWDAARGAARGAVWDAAWDAAWGAARVAARGAAWDAVWDAAWIAAWAAARVIIFFVSGLRGRHLTVICNFIHRVWLEAMK